MYFSKSSLEESKYAHKTIEMKGIYQKQSGLHNMLVAFKLKSQFCSGHWLTTTLYSDQVSCTHPWMQEHTVTCVLYLNRKVILLFYFLSKMLSNCLHHRNFFSLSFLGNWDKRYGPVASSCAIFVPTSNFAISKGFPCLIGLISHYLCKFYTFLTFHLMWPYVIYGTIRIMSLNVNCLWGPSRSQERVLNWSGLIFTWYIWTSAFEIVDWIKSVAYLEIIM